MTAPDTDDAGLREALARSVIAMLGRDPDDDYLVGGLLVAQAEHIDAFLALILAESAALRFSLETVTRERDEAILRASEHAFARGEAEGRLRMSEAAGVVEGWAARVRELEAGLSSLSLAAKRYWDGDDEDGSELLAEQKRARSLLTKETNNV